MNGQTNGRDPSVHYVRVNFLIALAFIIVIACVATIVYFSNLNEAIRNVVMLVLGRFLGYVDNIYNYEFGTTRSSTKKDDTIKELSTTASTTAATAATVAAAATGMPAPAVTTGKMEVAADNVVVNQEKK